MPDLRTQETLVWSEVARRGGVSFDGVAVVRGPGAREVGEALLGVGADRIIADETRIGGPATRSPIHDIVDSVILLHAWETPGDVDMAAHTAVAWVRPGGTLVIADLAVDRLRPVRPRSYPSSLLYGAFPDVCDALEARSVSAPRLGAAAVRAGVDDPRLVPIDRPVGVFSSPAEHRAAVRFGMWRGLDELDDPEVDGLLAGVDALAPVVWPHVEWEPWNVLAGRSRR
jgi:hypothetical protein